MVLIPNNESFFPGASGSIVTKHLSVFKKHMDSMLLGGTTITLDLPAGSTDCPDPTCRYNPSYDQFMGAGGVICRSCRGKGKVYQHRETQYKCNRRWENEPIAKALTGDQATEGGRIKTNLVRVKTHIASYGDILKSTGATIDDIKIKLFKSPRKTGLNGQLCYVISWWEEANK
jgi:hypothetical protein